MAPEGRKGLHLSGKNLYIYVKVKARGKKLLCNIFFSVPFFCERSPCDIRCLVLCVRHCVSVLCVQYRKGNIYRKMHTYVFYDN